jgi:16S rRNA (cytidine1402-2'-O)-methyltransferase
VDCASGKQATRLAALADPGARLVAAAHAAGVRVVALPGASAIALAIAASGLNGQSFSFVGYLPIDAVARSARIRELEAASRRQGQTQVMIETPYRNPALLSALMADLQPTTQLSVSVGLTLASESTRSDSVARWRAAPTALAADIPAVFSFLAR